MSTIRISLCTVSMNRLFTLKETLQGNIAACRTYGNAELVLLDYNSTDGLEDWIREEFSKDIEEGLLVFYQIKAPLPRFFCHCHSRNIVFRLATGTILCNVNADYHVGTDMLDYISNVMPPSEPLALIADLDGADRDNLGRICMRREDFYLIGGFDESFKGYGYEDIDLNLRLKMAGVRLKYLPDTLYSNYVAHEDLRRLENSYDYHHLKRAFVRKIDPGKSTVLFFYKDHRLETGTLIKSHHNFPSIQEEGWLKGCWSQSGNQVLLQGLADDDILLTEELLENIPHLRHGEDTYREVTGEANWRKILLYKSIIYNYQLLRNRRKSNSFRANTNGFGKGIVVRNFCEQIQLK